MTPPADGLAPCGRVRADGTGGQGGRAGWLLEGGWLVMVPGLGGGRVPLSVLQPDWPGQEEAEEEEEEGEADACRIHATRSS